MIPKKPIIFDGKTEKGRRGSFERLPSLDLDKHESYLSGDASPAKKDQELGLLHIKTH